MLQNINSGQLCPNGKVLKGHIHTCITTQLKEDVSSHINILIGDYYIHTKIFFNILILLRFLKIKYVHISSALKNRV